MNFDSLDSYDQVISYLDSNKRKKHLLFGNGFSMSYDPSIFSYNALSEFLEKTSNDLLRELFKVINTKNFELVMQQLDNFVEIAKVFNVDQSLVTKIVEASETLKNRLIESVSELHPEHSFSIPEDKCRNCQSFLNKFMSDGSKIFSTNYDLLMYWVLMRGDSKSFVDGFGRELENPEEVKKGLEPEWSELRWGVNKNKQTIFYLHGTLPIFDTGIDVVKEVYDSQSFLLEKVKDRMNVKNYPIFVTAGNAGEKLNHIMHNKYLAYCYDNLCNIDGSLVTFGFKFGEYDTHIIDAINKAAHQGMRSFEKLLSVYIGVYSDDDLRYMKTIKNKFMCKVNFYDARTVNIWG